MKRQSKKALSMLLAVVLCLSLAPMPALAADSDFTIENGVLTKYNGPGGDVVIPDGVTSIGMAAFAGCTGLTSVSISNSVTSIGGWAFWDCTGLTSVSIPNSVTSIGSGAFIGCIRLTSVTIPNGVTSIGQGAFINCTHLTSMTIPNGVTSIGNDAFHGCTGLTSVTIPNSVTSIGDSAFSYCTGLISITIPNSVTSIGGSVFSSCTGLTSVTIPDSMTTIEFGMFLSCTSLTDVTIPNSVTSIRDHAFNGCTSLTSVTIPDSVTNIGRSAFAWCIGLTAIEVSVGNQNYVSVDGVLFSKSLRTLEEYPGGKKGAYIVPDSVTSIGDHAFNGCTDLTNVTIPNSVTSIGEGAFNATGLTGMTIPNGVTSIENGAFSFCEDLANVTIPNSVTSIGESAFYDCTSLTDVYYSGNETQWAAISINNYNEPLTSASIHYTEYIYDTPDPAGDMALPAEELEQVDTQAQAVKAVENLTASMTQTQKEAPTGIDLATLYAETAAAKVSTKKVTGSELLINAAALKDLQTAAQQTTEAVESALVSGGVTTARYVAKTATLSTSATGARSPSGWTPTC